MNRKILGLLSALALAAGCDIATKTDWQGPVSSCKPAGPTPAACVSNAECCSYACKNGVCAANTVVGGTCRTTNDCGAPSTSFTQMTCKSGSCTPTVAGVCRDNADVCTSSTQCCGHHCSATVGGSCVPNQSPVITVNAAMLTVPRNQPWPMSQSATALDPDPGETATLIYGWSITATNPAGASGALSAPAGMNPTFNPGSSIADYLMSLTVTDFWGATSTTSFTLHVVNLPPVVSPAKPTVTTARNVGTLNVAMGVSDANGDQVTCTWAICRPNSTTSCLTAPAAPAPFTAPTGSLAAPPQSLSMTFPTGLVGTQEGNWEVRLACSDGLASTTGTTTVTVTNTPPTVTVPATRTFNLGADAATTPTDSIVATATDDNGDSIASWTWVATAVPPTSTVTTATLTGAATDTVSFKPDKVGDYTFTITVCDPEARNAPYVDRGGGCTTKTVIATVYPYVRSLAPATGAALDAAFARGATLARLVLAGSDGTSGALWDYDLAAVPATAPVKTALGGVPTAVTLTPDGGTALAGDALNVYKVALGAAPTLTTWSSPISVNDVIAVSSSDAFVFGKTGTTTPNYYYRIALATGTPTIQMRAGTWGAAITGMTDTWFFTDAYYSQLFRYHLQGNNPTQDSVMTSFTGGKLWSSGNGAHVFADNGQVFAVPATAPATMTPLAVNLGLTAIRSVDTSPTESWVLAAPSGVSYVARYNSSLTPMVQDVLPHWGYLGTDRTLQPLFAFVSNDGKTAYVVVSVLSGTPAEYGLYTYALP